LSPQIKRSGEVSGRKGEEMLRGIGWPELLILLAIVVIVFGVGKLPEVGEALGKAIREFRRSVTGQGEDEREED